MAYTPYAHIEVKKDGKWHHFGTTDLPCSSIVLAAMAGVGLDSLSENVRMHICPAAKIHRMPDDAAEVTKLCYGQDAGRHALHSISVLTAEDLRRLQKDLNKTSFLLLLPGGPYSLEDNIFHMHVNGGTLSAHRGWDDLRVILWFSG